MAETKREKELQKKGRRDSTRGVVNDGPVGHSGVQPVADDSCGSSWDSGGDCGGGDGGGGD